MTMLTRRHPTSNHPNKKSSLSYNLKNRISSSNNNKRIVRYPTSFRKDCTTSSKNAALRLRLKHRAYMYKKKVTTSSSIEVATTKTTTTTTTSLSTTTTTTTSTSTEDKITDKRVKKIRFGGYIIDSWYISPYPLEYCNLSMLYICEFCFKYMRTASIAERHKYKCKQKHPPGDEIYRQGNISVFEVDGRKNKMYCLNLCLLAKMFLDHKTLFYDVEPFLFYILTETDEHGCHFVGYFSKEKKSTLGYNVSCILILPIYQRKGYGQYLIDFSYLLTKEENTVGSPEKPLSGLGAISYQKYWKHTLYQYFTSNNNTDKISIQDLSQKTGMTPDDIVATLHKEHILVMHNNQLVLNIDKEKIKREKEKKVLSLDPSKLKWTPYTLSQERLSRLLDIE